MKKTKFTGEQVVFALRQTETGTRAGEVCRKMGIPEAIFYHWKKKCGGLGVSEVRRLKQLEDENFRLKRMVADLSLGKQMLQEVLQKKLYSQSNVENSLISCVTLAGSLFVVHAEP